MTNNEEKPITLINILKTWAKVSESPIGIILFWPYLIIVLTFYATTRCLTKLIISLTSLNSSISNEVALKYCNPSKGIFGFIEPIGNFFNQHFFVALLISAVIWIGYKFLLYKIRKNYPNFLVFD